MHDLKFDKYDELASRPRPQMPSVPTDGTDIFYEQIGSQIIHPIRPMLWL